MNRKILTLLIGMMFLFSITGIYAYSADTPYTVVMNFIVGSDTSFTVTLAGAEVTIDFNPATLNSKNVEPDSQNATASTPIATITNTGNVNLDFKHKMNTTMPTWANVSYNIANTVDWTQMLNETVVTIDTTVVPAGTTDVYLWANFTSAIAGTTARSYQINTTASA